MHADLVERAMRGDQGAFASLATDWVDRCYALAYRVLRDHHAAQDATQQALLGAWRDLPRLRDYDRFEPWLYRLVLHACYQLARGERRSRARVVAIRANFQPSSSPDVANSVASRDELEWAFRTLTPEQRAVVVLHHHLGYPLTEIAATLGIPVGTARSRLHNAVRQLRTVRVDGSRRAPSRERNSRNHNPIRRSTRRLLTGSRTTPRTRRARCSTPCSRPTHRSNNGALRACRGGSR
jgi:RNA polymerase sigma-70 factor (ECF subfamily)